MKKIILFVALIFLSNRLAFAEVARVKVNGMVCAFCAQGIKKKFTENPSVEKCEVDLDKKEVVVSLKKDKKISDEDIGKVIKESGFAVMGIERQEK